jgi:hypothetical protein
MTTRWSCFSDKTTSRSRSASLLTTSMSTLQGDCKVAG